MSDSYVTLALALAEQRLHGFLSSIVAHDSVRVRTVLGSTAQAISIVWAVFEGDRSFTVEQAISAGLPADVVRDAWSLRRPGGMSWHAHVVALMKLRPELRRIVVMHQEQRTGLPEMSQEAQDRILLTIECLNLSLRLPAQPG